MAPEPGLQLSPVSSGRTSPIRRSRERADEDLYKKDKNYRRYASGVERALSSFDTALQEWADYISFLGRLLKALQAHPANIAVIPMKTIVAKRLAQSLDPKLPSGVHQKALEVYAYIFSIINKDTLARDLPIYLPGLTPTLSFASLAVRPVFLSLLETYLLPVNASALHAALKALILALLPGLEEETSEDFERTLRLLENLRDAVRVNQVTQADYHEEGTGDNYFWQCFFLASITSASRRQGALAFLIRKLPRLGADTTDSNELSSDVKSVVSPEPGLLIRCFAVGLSDDQPLVQRGFLDLLVTHLPLNSPILQGRVITEDLDRLLAAAAGVVVRRDMSLNRRLWTWFLGPEQTTGAGADSTPGSPVPSSAHDATTSRGTVSSARTRYFGQYGLQALVRGIRGLIGQNHKSPTERARPFRICLSLMDRWEVGGLVVPEIFLPIINSVREYEQVAAKEQFSEVLRSASVFFDGVESGLIWGELAGLTASAIRDHSSDCEVRLDKLRFVKFVVTHFNVREEEMLVVHIPTVVLALLVMIREADSARLEEPGKVHGGSQKILALAVNIAQDLINMVPERAFLVGVSANDLIALGRQKRQLTIQNEEILNTIQRFYVQDQGNIEVSSPPISAGDIAELLLRETSCIVSRVLLSCPSDDGLEPRTKLFVTLLSKTPSSEALKGADLFSAFQQLLESSPVCKLQHLPFSTLSASTSAICSLHAKSHLSTGQISRLTPWLVRQAWSHISPTNPKYHLESVRCLWQLQSAVSPTDHDIEAAISTVMSENDISGTFALRGADAGRRFAVLWTHSVQGHGGLGETGGDFTQAPNGGNHGKRQAGMRAYEYMLTRPLFLLLDALGEEGTELSIFTRGWLQNLSSVDKLFQVFVTRFLVLDFLQLSSVTAKDSSFHTATHKFGEEDDLELCLYYLQTLSNVLRWSSNNVWASMAKRVIAPIDKAQGSPVTELEHRPWVSFQAFFTEVCMRVIMGEHSLEPSDLFPRISRLHRVALSVLHQILLSPHSAALADLELEYPLIEKLMSSVEGPDAFVQVSLLDVVFAALKLRVLRATESPTDGHRRTSSKDTAKGSLLSLAIERSEKEGFSPKLPPPPPQLVKCLQEGFCSVNSRPVLDSWINFLTECLPLFSETIFQILIPLVECLCGQISGVFDDLKSTFKDSQTAKIASPESSLIALLNGLEQILAAAHDRLAIEELKTPNIKSPEQPQGFLSNMVSGVFASEAPQTRSATANNRLTVLLSFKDSVRICFAVWSWGGYGSNGSPQDTTSLASFAYTSLRMRNRARRILEHLFAAETLECLETLVEIWLKSPTISGGSRMASVFGLLHVLDGSRPKHTIPAIFNAIYSRTNPHALEPTRKSTLTSDLADVDIVVFLVEYARSLEDDAMDEIWADCLTFLRDVLGNPFPHRQILPRLLEFTAILGEKADNTNFGEQRKMRRELSVGELFVRLLTATFTAKPISFSQDGSPPAPQEKGVDWDSHGENSGTRHSVQADDIVTILASIVPNLGKTLGENDRILGATTSISTSIIGPTFRAKSFPQNVTKSTLDLLYQLARIPNAQKSWKKDISDAFHDHRFFSSPISLIENNWLPLLRQWTLNHKDCILEILPRISSPTTAGLVFGVGASSARQEADRKTQLNLRRIALLILAADEDAFVANMLGIEEKLVELLTTTAASSPSSIIRAEVYMVLRALVLKISALHLAPLWPIINYELQAAISSVVPSLQSDIYNNSTILQACKLLDMLLVIEPDEFQLHEWLFVTDTIDAVYRPADQSPVALVDEISEELGSTTSTPAPHIGGDSLPQRGSAKRQLLIGLDAIKDVQKDDLLGKVLKPFFSQLSIYAFENTYSMGTADWKACSDSLLCDLFDNSTIVG
ncbi:hypothetical protein FGG08_002712 [Glutinoglossum americanum]|uniref:Dopey N-terminal domain-containing protein n=1 Tax=Glutinoglossum americanum TaxID=1670608 RepID=A0A9P8IB51_9PEZI|nr:hypothetical protein FGG08_002712 [Glutinoglossum americanum]